MRFSVVAWSTRLRESAERCQKIIPADKTPREGMRELSGRAMPNPTRDGSKVRVAQIKCPESQAGALGAGDAKPGEGFGTGGSLREVSEPGRRCVRPGT